MTRVSWIISWVHFKIHGKLLAFSWYQKLLVCAADICEGNPDERFLMLPNVHKGIIKDKSSEEAIQLYITFIHY